MASLIRSKLRNGWLKFRVQAVPLRAGATVSTDRQGIPFSSRTMRSPAMVSRARAWRASSFFKLRQSKYYWSLAFRTPPDRCPKSRQPRLAGKLNLSVRRLSGRRRHSTQEHSLRRGSPTSLTSMSARYQRSWEFRQPGEPLRGCVGRIRLC